MPVPITKEDVQDASRQVSAGIHSVGRTPVDSLGQPLVADNPHRALESRWLILVLVRTLLDESEHPGEFGPELSKRRIVRHDPEYWIDVQNTYRIQQGRRNECAERMSRADSILYEVVYDGLAKNRVEDG